MTGYLLINKPKNITSFGCVQKIKRIINQKIKVGHAGTLDPFATGLLIICVGRETTKSIDTLLNLDKEYIVKAKLGELTDTLDHTGEPITGEPGTCAPGTGKPGTGKPGTGKPGTGKPGADTSGEITKNDLLQAIHDLGKEYTQTPPIYSALKYQGKPLHKLAREGRVAKEKLEEIIKEKSRTVRLYNIELMDYTTPYFTFRAHVSKGTYIRSLANDIAQKAGSCATTYELERTKIGSIPLAKAVPLDKISNIDDVRSNLLNKEQFEKLLT